MDQTLGHGRLDLAVKDAVRCTRERLGFMHLLMSVSTILLRSQGMLRNFSSGWLREKIIKENNL